MRRYLLYPSVLFVFLFSSCSDKGDPSKVQLFDTNARDEVSLMTDLRFSFSTDIAHDTVLYKWDSTQYVEFKPEIYGLFRWETASELVFSPKRELAPATEFTATITEKILTTDRKLSFEVIKLKFFTASLSLLRTYAFWSVDEGKSDIPNANIKLNFNYKVDPNEVRDLLKITVGKDKFIPVLTDAAPNDIITFGIKDFPTSDDDTKTKVSLAKGLVPYGGNKAIQEEDVRNIIVPSPYKLEVLTAEPKHEGVEGIVTISTSQEISSTTLEDYISINPEISFSTEATANGFTITSQEFDANKEYELTITKGLKGRAGGKLKADYTRQIVFGKLRPTIKITSDRGAYISGDGNKLLMVNIVNVKKVKVVISKIYENNLMASTRYNFSAGDYDEYYDDYYYYNERDAYELGDEIWSKEYTSTDLPKQGNARLLKLDFTDKIPDYHGVYHVKISSDDNYWLRDQRIISISDIGLISKKGKDRVYVFANSIKTAASLPGVEVRLVGANNQLIDKASTNGDGVAILSLKEKNVPGFRPTLVTARLNDDFTYLPFSKTSVNLSGFDVGGKRENASGMDLFIYGERDIYRPGETINISAIIRNFDWQTPSGIPVKVRLLLPNGKELANIKKTLNEEGSFQASFSLPASAVTGSYTAEVFTSNDVLLNSKRILVEEFMPDRIKVTTSLSSGEAKPDETVSVDLSAMSFFGPPAANRNYDMEFTIKRRFFSPKKYSNFNFYISDLNASFGKTVAEGTTDENGDAAESYKIPSSYENMGKLQMDIFTTVFDETGRPVSKKDQVDIYTQDIFYGLKRKGSYFSTGQNIATGIIAVDKDGNAQSGVRAKVTVIKHEYRTVWERSGSYYRYRSQSYQEIIESKEIPINGENTTYYFEANESGRYEIRISKPDINSFVSQSFYCYGYGRTYNSSFEVNNEGKVDIELDKEQYEVNDKANVLFKTPFSGKLLVTVENHEVLEHYYLQTDKRSAALSLQMDERYLPNVYITATLIKAHEESEMPLTVAHGTQPIVVGKSTNQLPLEIAAVEKSRSGVKQKISLKTKPLAKMTVAVVDEGILQLTGYQNPDPYAHFYQKRALGVRSYDLYPLLFPETSLELSSVGGDGYDLNKRVNPLNNRRVKLTRFWSGIITADGSGNATYEIDIPKFSGDLRIMAVAYQDEAFAASSTNMKVADPMVISTALPRFLSPGDTVMVPVTISNTTAKTASGKATISVDGPLKIVGSGTERIKVDANKEFQTQFRIVADQVISESKITTTVDAFGESFKEEIDMTIRPASPLLKVSGSGSVKGGASVTADFETNSFIPGSIDRKLVVSKSPVIQFSKDLDYLVRYPYGCAEQTISGAFPQLYFADLAEVLGGREAASEDANYHIREAIKKLQMMQLYNGGLTLWPSGGNESWWTTTYAAHFLYEAREAGFKVEDKMLDGLYEYMINRLKAKEQITYYYNRSQNRKIAPRQVAYSLYILALAGKPQRSTMNYYKANLNLLSMDARYMLAAAYALAGDIEKYREIVPSEFKGEIANNSFGGSFYSYTRDLAIALNVMLKVDPDNQQVGQLAKSLSEQMKTKRWLNTQERSFGFLALGKMARRSAKGNATAVIKADGKEIGTYSSKILKLEGKKINSDNIQIVADGSGEIFYFWEAEGISKDGSYKEEDNFLKVRRKFFNRFGGEISGNTFRQNDLIVVRISIESAYQMNIENVVISDIIPAGFEIENPRIDEVPGTEWIKGKSMPTHMDIRDDRINYFVDVNSYSTQNYYYVVRAVSKGNYRMGPVSADAMYNGEYHSYNGGGMIRIVDK